EKKPRFNRSFTIFWAEQHRTQAQGRDARPYHEGLAVHRQEREQILAYCAEDVEALHKLLFKRLPNIDLAVALHRGEAIAALTRSEHIGVPIDMDVFSQLSDKKTWRNIRDSMVPLVDVHSIYIRD